MKKKTPVSTPAPAPARCENLEELNRQLRAAVEVRVRTPRGALTLHVEPLMPARMDQVEDLLFVPRPPPRKDANGQELPTDPEYAQAVRHAGRLARAVALWHAVPVLRQGAPPDTEQRPEAIAQWMGQQATDTVLATLWEAVQRDFVPDREVEEAADHFTGPA